MSAAEPSLCTVLCLVILFSVHGGIAFSLWSDALSSAIPLALKSTALASLVLYLVLSLILRLDNNGNQNNSNEHSTAPTKTTTTSAMAGGKTPPKPKSQAVRFRSVAAVVFVLSALAFTWQNGFPFSSRPSEPPPAAQDPFAPPPWTWMDVVTSPLGQSALAFIVLVAIISASGTVKKPAEKASLS